MNNALTFMTNAGRSGICRLAGWRMVSPPLHTFAPHKWVERNYQSGDVWYVWDKGGYDYAK